MTVTADNKKRVILPTTKPGERFDVEISENGFVLRRLGASVSHPATVIIEKREGFSVGVLGRPIDEQALKDALAEFP
jgi:hypothetical protein